MMQTFFLTFVFFAAAVLLMTAAVLISGRSLKGSCGGPECACVKQGKDILSCEVDGAVQPRAASFSGSSTQLPVADSPGSAHHQ